MVSQKKCNPTLNDDCEKKYKLDVFDFKYSAKFNISTLFWHLDIDFQTYMSNSELSEKLVQNDT